MTRTIPAALAALVLLAPAGAAAQWREEPMTVRLDPSATDVLAGPFPGAGAGAGLMIVDRASPAAEVRPFHSLLQPQAAPFPFPAQSTASAYRAGRLAQNVDDAVADVARLGGTGVQIAFGNDPATLRTSALTYSPTDPPNPAFVRLLARDSDVLVVPFYPADWNWASLKLVDFDAAGASTVVEMDVHPLFLDPVTGQPFEALPIRLSHVARANEVDDVALTGWGGLLLFLHDGAAAPAALAEVKLAIVEVGGRTDVYPSGARPPWLPDFVERGPTLGVAALDADLDGDLDLVFPQSSRRPDASVQGDLVWVEWTGAADPTALQLAALSDYTVSPWHDLGATLGLPDPVVVRQVKVAGLLAAAVWDRDLQEIVVIWPDYGAGRLATWRAPAPGLLVSDIRQVDLVGTAEPDLVVVVDNSWGASPPPDAVLVYPDSTGPVLSWAPGSPGTPVRGVEHRMGVLLDPAGPITVEWIEGAPTTAPSAQGVRLVEHVFPGTCASPPPDLVVMVRATDDIGIFTEIGATLPVSARALGLSLRGAASGDLFVLEPSGVTTAVFDAVGATSCGVVSWGGAWPAGGTIADESGPGWLRRTVVLTEAAYPALLADPSPAVSITTTDPAAAPAVVTLGYRLDGSGLVEVIHDADRATLADGEIAVLRTRLRSRITVPLPGVRIVDVLSGLVPAGPPIVEGAIAVAVGRDGAEIVIDALPAAPAEVTVELPVRSVAGRGNSAVEVRSSAGWPLTPAAHAGDPTAPLPGCGCGSGGTTAGLAALALALAARIRRRSRAAT